MRKLELVGSCWSEIIKWLQEMFVESRWFCELFVFGWLVGLEINEESWILSKVRISCDFGFVFYCLKL